MAPLRSQRPQAVLFACGMNSVRSPMAAGLFKHFFARTYVGSAGVRKGELDPFAVAAMEELGLDIAKHKPMTFEEMEEWEGLNFDLIVTLSPEAHHRALELTRWHRGHVILAQGGREPQDRGRREVVVFPHLARCSARDDESHGTSMHRFRGGEEHEFRPAFSKEVRAAVFQVEPTWHGPRRLLLGRHDEHLVPQHGDRKEGGHHERGDR